MSHYSSKYGGGNYYNRGRDNERGRDRDKDWGRDWKRKDRDRSREGRNRSPSRDNRYSDYNRRPPDKYYGGRGGNRFASGAKYGNRGYQGQQPGYSSTNTNNLIREKDLVQGSNRDIEGSGYNANHYQSYLYNTQEHYSGSNKEANDKDPKDDPLFQTTVEACLTNMKTRGDYDQVRKECFSDIDTKAAFLNLNARIKNTVDKYLNLQVFNKDLDKVKTREGMRKKIVDTPYFTKGVESVVNQILGPKISTLIRPKIEEEVYKYLNIDLTKEGATTESVKEAEEAPPERQTPEHEENPKTSDSDTNVNSQTNENPHSSSQYSEEHRTCQSLKEGDSYSTSEDMVIDDDSSCSAISVKRSPINTVSPINPIPERTDKHSSSTTEYDAHSSQNGISGSNMATVLHNIHVPPPMSISTSTASLLAPSVIHPCQLPDMSKPPPFLAPPAATYSASHFSSLGVLPPASAMLEQGIPLPPLPAPSNVPPPLLPPLPLENTATPPPPPSPPKTHVPPPPPPDCGDEACSSPPSPHGGGKISTANWNSSQQLLVENNDSSEPLPPGEEPETYFSQLNSSSSFKKQISPVKQEVCPEPLPVADNTGAKEDEEMEEVEEDEEIVEDDSEEESPMFEKIGEVSPPRAVDLQNSELVQELSKELLGNSNSFSNHASDHGDSQSSEQMSTNAVVKTFGDNECRYLESTPNFDQKLSYYKRIPDS